MILTTIKDEYLARWLSIILLNSTKSNLPLASLSYLWIKLHSVFSNLKGDSRIQVRIKKEVIQQILIDYFLSHLLTFVGYLLTFVGYLLIICWIFVNNCLLERHSWWYRGWRQQRKSSSETLSLLWTHPHWNQRFWKKHYLRT